MKKYFTKCFACWSGYGGCKKQRLPRKQKKSYKRFLLVTGRIKNLNYMIDMPSSCNISDDYKRNKPQFYTEGIIKKYHNAFTKMAQYCNDTGEVFYIDDNGRLSWYWEDYNGLYTYSGLMPFCYNEEDARNTWAFSEVSNLIEGLLDYPEDFVFPESVVSDRTLLEFLSKSIN